VFLYLYVCVCVCICICMSVSMGIWVRVERHVEYLGHSDTLHMGTCLSMSTTLSMSVVLCVGWSVFLRVCVFCVSMCVSLCVNVCVDTCITPLQQCQLPEMSRGFRESLTQIISFFWCGVTTIGSLLQILGLFCKRAL